MLYMASTFLLDLEVSFDTKKVQLYLLLACIMKDLGIFDSLYSSLVFKTVVLGSSNRDIEPKMIYETVNMEESRVFSTKLTSRYYTL